MLKCKHCEFFKSYEQEGNEYGECEIRLPSWMDEKRNSSRAVWGNPEFGDGCDLGRPIVWMA